MRLPKYCRNLNDKQKQILILLYKFRFATVKLIADYQSKSETYTYKRLEILKDQGFIGKKQTKEDKINRRPAVYFLDARGINYLKADSRLNSKVLHLIYRDKNASQQFMDQCLLIFKLHNKLRQLYGQNMQFYSRSELYLLENQPKPLPSFFCSINNNYYFVETPEDNSPQFAYRRLINKYLEYCTSDDWTDDFQNYPGLLLICQNPRQERRLQKLAANLLQRSEADDIEIFTTTATAIFNSSLEDKIWTDVTEPDELIKLY